MSANSPTHCVEENGILIKHLTTIIITPPTGPNAKLPSIAGRSENYRSSHDGNINGIGNFKNI
jgi:hypothetical protein